MSRPAITTASLSDVGRVRTRNEDACSEFQRPSGHRLLVVADGMGGHRGGATASRVAVETVGEVFARDPGEPPEMLRAALEAANARILEMAVEDAELRGMGTTAVALLLTPDGQGWVAHVGDSRAYRCRDHLLRPLTRDHSVVAELERRGLITAEQAAVHPRRNEILRSVGVRADVEVEISPVDVRPGDRFLLCSDGLSGMLDETEIAVILDEHPPAEAVRLLVERANEHGGTDNVTVQVLVIGEADETGEASAGEAGEAGEEGAAAAATPVVGAPGLGARPSKLVVIAVLACVAALGLLWLVCAGGDAEAAAAAPAGIRAAADTGPAGAGQSPAPSRSRKASSSSGWRKP